MHSRPIRVLQLGSPTGLYGAERWILALIRHLPSERIESIVGVIRDAPDMDGPICQHAAAMGFRTEIFDAPGRLSHAAVGLLRDYIRAQRIDILHTHGYKTDILGFLATRGTECKLVVTPHGWSKNAGFKLALYEVLDRLVFAFADAVVPLSKELCDGLRQLPGLRRRLQLIPNGVDLAELDTVQQPASELLQHKARGDYLIGYIGQLIPRKGLDTLIRSFAAVTRANKRLYIVGEGAQREELEALCASLGVSDRVTFCGYRADRIELLKCFDLFVLPSTLEGIPRCLLEAMALAIPVIATDIPGCTDLVSDSETGRLFQPHDAGTLAQLITELATQPQEARRLALAGQSLVRRDFSAAGMARRYAELFLRLTSACDGRGAAVLAGAGRDE